MAELLTDAKKLDDFDGFEMFSDWVRERRFRGGNGFGGFLNQFSPNGPKFIDAIDKNEKI